MLKQQQERFTMLWAGELLRKEVISIPGSDRYAPADRSGMSVDSHANTIHKRPGYVQAGI